MADPGRFPLSTAMEAATAAQRAGGEPYAVLLARGTLELGFYAPADVDDQTPHDHDEVYVVVSGTGTFVRDQESFPFAPGDALFVAAGVPHRFVEGSEDLSLWVVFWGPPGGELKGTGTTPGGEA